MTCARWSFQQFQLRNQNKADSMQGEGEGQHIRHLWTFRKGDFTLGRQQEKFSFPCTSSVWDVILSTGNLLFVLP